MCIDRMPQTASEDHTDELADMESPNSFEASVSASVKLGRQKQQEEKPSEYLLLGQLFLILCSISLCR